MRKSWWEAALGVTSIMLIMLVGCTNVTGPKEQSQSVSDVQSVLTAVTQDRAQLTVAGVTTAATKAVFSVGWKEFVGPNILQADSAGKAYAIAQIDTATGMIHPSGLDMGTVTLSYSGGSVELTKHIARDSGVVYGSFDDGPHGSLTSTTNIPFVPNGVYSFTVSGSTAYSAATFTITAPASLLSITGHADGDTVSASTDVVIGWTGGSAADSILVRVVPHLRPADIPFRESMDTLGAPCDHQGGKRPMGHHDGMFMTGGPLSGMGPEFQKGIDVMVSNSGSYTLTASEIATLLNGTSTADLMIGVSQVVKQDVLHDSGTTSLVLRSGDRLVLHVK